MTFNSAAKPLDGLTPGSYQLVVEAAREVGGRELLRVPFEWPPKAPTTAQAKGEKRTRAGVAEVAP